MDGKDDSLSGGGGDDIFMVASQGDFADYYDNGGADSDTLMLGAGVTLPGRGANLVSIEVTIYG